jgi:hypothetical protein
MVAAAIRFGLAIGGLRPGYLRIDPFRGLGHGIQKANLSSLNGRIAGLEPTIRKALPGGLALGQRGVVAGGDVVIFSVIETRISGHGWGAGGGKAILFDCSTAGGDSNDEAGAKDPEYGFQKSSEFHELCFGKASQNLDENWVFFGPREVGCDEVFCPHVKTDLSLRSQ